jgi:hypothetical protein
MSEFNHDLRGLAVGELTMSERIYLAVDLLVDMKNYEQLCALLTDTIPVDLKLYICGQLHEHVRDRDSQLSQLLGSTLSNCVKDILRYAV